MTPWAPPSNKRRARNGSDDGKRAKGTTPPLGGTKRTECFVHPGRAVLHVHRQPIEALRSHNFSHFGGRSGQPRADRHLPGPKPGFQSFTAHWRGLPSCQPTRFHRQEQKTDCGPVVAAKTKSLKLPPNRSDPSPERINRRGEYQAIFVRKAESEVSANPSTPPQVQQWSRHKLPP